MRRIKVYNNKIPSGVLEEKEYGKKYIFRYFEDYNGEAISLTMPVESRMFEFDGVPPFFDGFLPEGLRLENLLRDLKIDRNNYMSQLIAIGKNLKGTIEIQEFQ